MKCLKILIVNKQFQKIINSPFPFSLVQLRSFLSKSIRKEKQSLGKFIELFLNNQFYMIEIQSILFYLRR